MKHKNGNQDIDDDNIVNSNDVFLNFIFAIGFFNLLYISLFGLPSLKVLNYFYFTLFIFTFLCSFIFIYFLIKILLFEIFLKKIN